MFEQTFSCRICRMLPNYEVRIAIFRCFMKIITKCVFDKLSAGLKMKETKPEGNMSRTSKYKIVHAYKMW